MNVTDKEKKILLECARNSIKKCFDDVEIGIPDFNLYPILKFHAGAFVTLTQKKTLRGCIGYITSDQPIFNTVCEAAVQAAFHDPRFYPLQKDEISKVSIEISLLSPPFPIKSYSEIILGTHGLIVEEKGRRGLLLPQVPIEHNMNLDQYLDSICHKAGLPANLWKEKQLNMSAFTAVVFSEESFD